MTHYLIHTFDEILLANAAESSGYESKPFVNTAATVAPDRSVLTIDSLLDIKCDDVSSS
jgi:hypothetical protein